VSHHDVFLALPPKGIYDLARSIEAVESPDVQTFVDAIAKVALKALKQKDVIGERRCPYSEGYYRLVPIAVAEKQFDRAIAVLADRFRNPLPHKLSKSGSVVKVKVLVP
jgi:hypothetical protein